MFQPRAPKPPHSTHHQHRAPAVNESVLVTEEQARATHGHERRPGLQRRRAQEPSERRERDGHALARAVRDAAGGRKRERGVEVEDDDAPAELDAALGDEHGEARAVRDGRRAGVEWNCGDDQSLPNSSTPGLAFFTIFTVLRDIDSGGVYLPCLMRMSSPTFRPGTRMGRTPAVSASISLMSLIGPKSKPDEKLFLWPSCARRAVRTLGGVGGSGKAGGGVGLGLRPLKLPPVGVSGP